MANKFKKVTKGHRKKEKGDSTLRTAMGLGVVAIIALVVFIVYGSNNSQQGTLPPAGQNEPAQALQNVQTAEKAAQAGSNDFDAQKRLADAYYDLGTAYANANDAQNAESFWNKAIGSYQKALAIKFDINAQTDMATLAFYTNQTELADTAFKQALEKEPDFLTAHLNYGVFLRDAKGDKEGAKKQWEFVANQAKDTASQNQAKEYLKTVQ